MNDPSERPKPPTLWQMLRSVAAAALGVQSNKNRQRDFNHDKPWHFIVLGVGFMLVLVLSLLLIVRLVLYFATG
ncbi:DUF2970 domain-containing protein [Pseudomonas sp. 3A(2025)]